MVSMARPKLVSRPGSLPGPGAATKLRVGTLAGILLLLQPLAPAGRAAAAGPGVPPGTAIPILDRLEAGAEQRNRREREAWIERMHRAAPGVDWRELERANSQENLLSRQLSNVIETGAWTEVGSMNQTGRTHVAMLHPVTGLVYVGTDRGGLWRGTIAGGPWTPLSDNVGAGVHGMTIVPGLPEVICTITDGGQVYMTIDGGAHWAVPTGLPDRVVSGIRIVREQGSRRVYLLVEGWRWTGSWDHSHQLLRSDDGGQSFSLVHEEPLATRPDIWIDRLSAGKPLYLMAGNALKRSTDLGVTFTTTGTAPVSGDRAVLAGSEAGAPTLYAALHAGSAWKLCRSTDAGVTWAYRSDISDFYETLCASTFNPQLVFTGGVNAARSTDGGATFALVNVWSDYYADPLHKLHADIYGTDAVALAVAPAAAPGAAAPSALREAILFDTDGGTFVSYDGGVSVNNLTLTGLGNGQYYSILTSRWNPRRIAAGSQDQGYQLSIVAAALPLAFTQVISGDYGHLTSAAGDHNMLWSDYPGLILLQPAESSTAIELQQFPPAGPHDWLPDIVADPLQPSRLYFCADHIWQIDRLAPDSYAYTRLPQDFSGGAGDFLTALAISRVDHNDWYAVTNSGRLWWSHSAGATWTASASSGPEAHYFYGTKLLPSPTMAATCFAGGAGYSGPAVYRTTDGGVNWTPVGSGLPPTLVHGLAFDNDVQQNLYAAADAGPFRYDAASGTWVNLLASSCCAPLTTYWDVEGVRGQGIVRFATYGRGIWDFVTGSTVGAPAAETARAAGPALEIAPNPAAARAAFAYSMPEAGEVRIEVFDAAGHRVATPVQGFGSRGPHAASFDLRAWNGRRLESGIYLVRIVSPEGVSVRRLAIAR